MANKCEEGTKTKFAIHICMVRDSSCEEEALEQSLCSYCSFHLQCHPSHSESFSIYQQLPGHQNSARTSPALYPASAHSLRQSQSLPSLCSHDSLCSVSQYFPLLVCLSSIGLELFRVIHSSSFWLQCQAQCWAQNELVNTAWSKWWSPWVDSCVSPSRAHLGAMVK